jgi:folate-binding protein YgfZ
VAILDLEQTYEQIHKGVVGIVLDCDVVGINGPQARSYLQSQCSQDLNALVPGDDAWTLLLSPEGRIDAFARVVIVSDEEALLIVEKGEGAALKERLLRFKLRVKADIELYPWRRAVLRGPKARDDEQFLNEGVHLAVSMPGCVGFDVVSENASLPDGIDAGAHEAFEVCRIEAGRPAMASELGNRTIPQEAGIVRDTVSFTKGCFPGQELLARIDARGNNVPRHLRGMIVHPDFADIALASGDVVVTEGKDVGAITSIAYSPRVKSRVALCYIRRSVEVPRDGLVRSARGEDIAVRIEDLPLVHA